MQCWWCRRSRRHLLGLTWSAASAATRTDNHRLPLQRLAITEWVIYTVFQKRIPDIIAGFEWGGNLDGHLMANCIRNIRTKNYLNLVVLLQATIDNVGDPFLRHNVVIIDIIIAVTISNAPQHDGDYCLQCMCPCMCAMYVKVYNYITQRLCGIFCQKIHPYT